MSAGQKSGQGDCFEKGAGAGNLVSIKLAPGIVLPHAKMEDIESPIVIVGVSRDGIVYEKDDTNPVY